MTSHRDSWVNAYEHIDYDIFSSTSNAAGKDERAERQAMLPSGSGAKKGRVSPPSSPEPDVPTSPSRFASGPIPPSTPIKLRHFSPLQSSVEDTGPAIPPKSGVPTPTLSTNIFQGPLHQGGPAVRMPAQVHAFSPNRTTDVALSPSAMSSPPLPAASSSTSSGTLASGSSSSHGFGFSSSLPGSNSGSSNILGAAPQLNLGAFGVGLGINDGALASHSERAVPSGQSSSQSTTSGRPPRPSSFKSYASSPLAVSLPSGSIPNPNFPQVAGNVPYFAGPSPSSYETGSSPFVRRTSKSDGFSATPSTSPPSISTSTDKNSPTPPLAPTSFPSRGSMTLYRLSASEDGVLAPPPGLSHPSVGGSNVRGPLPSVWGVGPRGGHTSGDPQNRLSTYSISGDSMASLIGGSKYPPLGFIGGTGTRPGTPVVIPGTPVSLAGSIVLGDRQSGGGLVAYMFDVDEDYDDDDEDEWLHDVEGDEEFFEYGFGPAGRKPVYSGSVADASINAKQPSSEYTQHGSLGSTAMLNGKSQQIPIPTSLSLPHPASSLPPPAGHPSKMRIPSSGPPRSWYSSVTFRGISNISGLVILILCLLGLFIVLPTAKAFTDNSTALKILGNTRINSTGQAVDDSKREFLEELVIVRFEPERR